MVRATRTLNPLPFQDLEPKRFEDLVRSLLYDFKDWIRLEATGRSGSDDGFDVRGWEAVPTTAASEATDEDDVGAPVDFLAAGKLWLIQCKRERAISPKKLIKYLDDIPLDQRAKLDGLIFAAACDFSKRTRDAFHAWCQQAGISEFHLWGKAELEDALLQPKNDGLLFAYFGISLVLRRRSARSELRSLLATKRKIIKVVGGVGDLVHRTVLLRDPRDDQYPVAPSDVHLIEPGKGFNYGWFARTIVKVQHDGIIVKLREARGYLADDGVHWDYIPVAGDQAIPSAYENPWEHEGVRFVTAERDYGARKLWVQTPDKNRATYWIYGIVLFTDILAIDEDGDGHTELPTIFVEFGENGPFARVAGTVRADNREAPSDRNNRIKLFPDDIPEEEIPTLGKQSVPE